MNKIDEEYLYKLIGQRLKETRRQYSRLSSKLTQGDLAKIINFERTSITNIELGKQKTPIHVIYQLCSILGVEIADLLPPVDEALNASSKLCKDKKVDKQIDNLIESIKN